MAPARRGSALPARDQDTGHPGPHRAPRVGKGTYLVGEIGLDLVIQLSAEGGERGASQQGLGKQGCGGRKGGDGGGLSTHWVPALFSEKKRSTKSPSLLGSKVEGTTTYSPGGRRKRVLTSRRLMNCSDRAREALDRKKSRFRCTAGWPTSWWEGRRKWGLQLSPPFGVAPRPRPRPQAPGSGQGARELGHGSVTQRLPTLMSHTACFLICKMGVKALPTSQGQGEETPWR